MSQITETGFQRTKLDEILADLQDKMITIFGDDLNLEPDTIDGEMLGIFAESYDNLTMLAEDVYQSFNPQTATGVALSRLVQLNGIRRTAGIKSVVTLKLGGNVGITIPEGSLVKNPSTNEQFKTKTPVVIGGTGFSNVQAEALVFGAITAPIGTITKIDNPVYGWQTVTNESAATPGRLEETDAQLRTRRKLSTVTPAQSIAESIYGALNNLANVIQAVVLENYTNVIDANTTPAHGIHVIVQGGDDTEIAQMIWLKKSLGCDMKGSTSVVINDSLGAGHVIKFSRPIIVDIYIVVNVVVSSGWPSNGDTLIKQNIVNWGIANQAIGEEVVRSRLYDPINDVPGHSVSSLFIGTAPAPTGQVNISVAYDELASFDISRITVNVL